MAQNMTLTAYLAQRGKKAKALTKSEAELLGIPYPLQAGWPRRYGAIEIDEAMLEELVAHAETARLATAERVSRDRGRSRAAPAPTVEAKQRPAAARLAVVATRLPEFPGFVLRPARRYLSRRAAPWT